MTHTNYDYIGGAIEGAIATGVQATTRSFLNKTGAVMAYGRLVAWDATNNRHSLLNATGQKPLGIVVKNSIYEDSKDAQEFVGYPDKRESEILTQGDIWVFTEQAVTPASPVFARHTANGANKDILARFRIDNDTSNADDVSAYFRWAGEYPAGGLAILTAFGLG